MIKFTCEAVMSWTFVCWKVFNHGFNDSAIPFLGLYPEKYMAQKDACIPVFTAALFTKAKTWKQPKCSFTEEWIKMWYIYSMEYYSTIKKNQIMSFAATRMDLESVILSEVRQRRRNIWHPLYEEFKRNNTNKLTYKTERDLQT